MDKFRKEMFLKGNTFLTTYKGYDIYYYYELYDYYMVVKDNKIIKSYILTIQGAKQFITKTINKNK